MVYDTSGGVGGASLAGRNPLAHAFNELPFGPEALASPASLLNALQGAEIRVGSSRPINGKLLSVLPETVQLGERGTLTRHRVTVLTKAGLAQFILEEADALSFLDDDLQAKVNKALADIAAHRTKGRREITLQSHGAGSRAVRVGYVTAAPLWKASFRLSLPSSGERAHLQGWAVLENMTGQDWHNVELTLTSGNPVSFRQAIYQAYYVPRPEVPVEVIGWILPKPDSGVLGPLKEGQEARAGEQPRLSASDQARTKTRQVAVTAVPAPAAGLPPPPVEAFMGENRPTTEDSHAVNIAAADAALPRFCFACRSP